MSLHHPLHRHSVLCASCLDNRCQLLMALPVLTEPLIQVPGLNPNSSRSCSWSYHSSRLHRGCRPHLLFPGKLHSEASLLLASRCQVTWDIPTSRTASRMGPSPSKSNLPRSSRASALISDTRPPLLWPTLTSRGNKSPQFSEVEHKSVCVALKLQLCSALIPSGPPGPWSSFPPGHPKPPGQREKKPIDGF